MDKNEGKFVPPKDGFEVLTDDSLMRGKGVHAGKRMGDVPADYLIWCYNEGKCSKSVKAYVTDNLDRGRKLRDELLKIQARKQSEGEFGERRDWGIDSPRNAKGFRSRRLPYNRRKLG